MVPVRGKGFVVRRLAHGTGAFVIFVVVVVVVWEWFVSLSSQKIERHQSIFCLFFKDNSRFEHYVFLLFYGENSHDFLKRGTIYN